MTAQEHLDPPRLVITLTEDEARRLKNEIVQLDDAAGGHLDDGDRLDELLQHLRFFLHA